MLRDLERVRRVTETGADVAQVVLFDRSTDAGEAEFGAWLVDAPITQVHDTLAMQLRDLARTRHPRKIKLSDAECAPHVAAMLGDQPIDRYGRWVFYPWSGALVHVLGPAEFAELRSDRNRYKLTFDEQERLRGLTVGIAGLSVGNIVALTLALEGVVGHLKLADFDTLELSNLNRIRAGVHQLGLRKTVVAARQILEFDPYARISLFHDGVHDGNLDAFLLQPRLDVLIDECDSIAIKFKLRERARELRMPVVMETSDRGMLDIERFDLEPERPIFHGLVGDVGADELVDIDSEKKATLMLKIIGSHTTSPRAAASMMEIDRSISAWPQLASDVTLGGATTTVVVRRLGLGLPVPSGRSYVEMERIITEGAPPAPLPGAEPPGQLPEIGLAARRRSIDEIPAVVRFAVEHAVMAPSGGNCQPWHFFWDEDRLWVTHDRLRSRNMLDGRQHGSWLAIGAALENLEIAAASRDQLVRFDVFPVPDDPTIVAEVQFLNETPRAGRAGWLPTVPMRVTNRRLAPPRALGGQDVVALTHATAIHQARLDLVLDPYSIAELGRILGAADRVRMLCTPLHREMMGEMRWTTAAAEASRDGLDVATLELDAFQRAAIGVIARTDVADEARRLGRARALEEMARDSVAGASALALVSFDGSDRAAWLRAGRAMQRFWLAATRLQFAVQPMTAILFMFEILDRSPEVYTPAEAATLADLRRRLNAIVAPRGATPAMLFRIAHAGPPTARSLRLPLDQVLEVGAPGGVSARPTLLS